MSALSFVSQIFKPAADLVDSLHTSDEERLAKKAQLLELQSAFLVKALEQEQEQLRQRAGIIQAEAKGEGILQRNWRPATMLVFLGMTVSYWFGWTPESVTEGVVEQVFGLIKLGLGGYVVGRSVEKTTKVAVDAFKKREQA